MNPITSINLTQNVIPNRNEEKIISEKNNKFNKFKTESIKKKA